MRELRAALSGQSPVWYGWAGGALALLAFWLRAFRLDGQSLWYDEGISVTLAPRSLEQITLSAAADIHPPLYYYLLHFWTAAAGNSEYAARYLSVVEGVMLVAVAFALGRRLASAEVGVLAGFLAATSPILVYYSQEARMYTQAALLAALSMYAFLQLVDGASPFRGLGRWSAYVIASVLAVYSHYYDFSILLVQNLYVAGLLVALARRASKERDLGKAVRVAAIWASGQLVILIAYVPWFALSYRQLLGWPSISEPFGLGDLIGRLFRAFSLGLSWDAAATPTRELVFVLLALAALLSALRSPGGHWRRAAGVVGVFLAVPVLTMYLASLQRPMYNPKFLLLAVPAYCLWLALGISGLRSAMSQVLSRFAGPSLGTAMGGVVVVGSLWGVSYSTARSLEAYYFDPKYARDNYRALVQHVETYWRVGDAVILNAPGQVEIFDYYFSGDQSALYPLPRQRPIVASETEAELRRIAEAHQRIWLVLWATKESDPEMLIERWLDEHLYKSGSRWFGSLRLVSYGGDVEGASDQEWADLAFGENVLLRAYGPLRWDGEPGSTLPVTLTWQAKRPIETRYKVFVHLLDAGEFIWGQHDSEPAGGYRLTTDWTPGELVQDRHGILVPEGTPPGSYRIEIGLYEPESGRRLEIGDQHEQPVGDRFLFGQVQVSSQRWPPQGWDPAAIQNRLKARLGPLALAGYNLGLVGDEKPRSVFSMMEVAHLTLFWQASETPAAECEVQVMLEASDGRRLLADDVAPAFSGYPMVRWRAGELVRQPLRLHFQGLARGEYSLLVGLRDLTSGALLPATGGETKPDGWLVIGRITAEN